MPAGIAEARLDPVLNGSAQAPQFPVALDRGDARRCGGRARVPTAGQPCAIFLM